MAPRALICILLFTALSASAQVVSFQPEKPVLGSAIEFIYNTADSAAMLSGDQSLTAQLLLMRSYEPGHMIEIELKKDGRQFKGSHALMDEKDCFGYLQFSDGEKTDNNSEKGWCFFIYGRDGKVLKSGHLSRGQAYQTGRIMGYKFEKNLAKARLDFMEENTLYPGDLYVSMSLWGVDMQLGPGDAAISRAKEELEKVYEQYKNDEIALSSLLPWFDRTGQKERSIKIRTDAIAKNPTGVIAASTRMNEVYKEKDAKKRFAMLEKLENDLPVPDGERTWRDPLYVRYAVSAKEFDKAIARLEITKKPSSELYNSIAWPLIEKEEKLDKAVELARKGVDAQRNSILADQPTYLTKKMWEEQSSYQLGMVLDTYATGLEKLSRLDDAEQSFAEAYSILKGEMAEINNRYIGILLRQKKYPNAIDVAATCIRNNKSDEQTTAYFKQAFMATGKAEEEFVEEMKKIDNASKEKLRGEIRKAMTDEPAPDFELRSLEGKIVKLSTLKGKIVVVDFWATWCNPCRMSFPFLQKVYEKYQNDPRIAILALNTWEREKGEAREKTVRKFIDENKYTFPVLFDETTVQKYGVDGIPTKFILDGNGRIRYKEVGFNGGPDMVNKMDLVFEMLLAEMK